MSQPWDYIAKLVCIGDSGTGKSSVSNIYPLVLLLCPRSMARTGEDADILLYSHYVVDYPTLRRAIFFHSRCHHWCGIWITNRSSWASCLEELGIRSRHWFSSPSLSYREVVVIFIHKCVKGTFCIGAPRSPTEIPGIYGAEENEAVTLGHCWARDL